MGRKLAQNTLPKLDVEPLELANKFAEFFTQKIRKIRKDLEKNTELSHDQQFTLSIGLEFQSTTCDEIKDLIMSSGSKLCSLDPVPTSMVKTLLPSLCPVITVIVNKSLKEGLVPATMKAALVRPLIKSNDLDPDLLKSYRPVSNLPFISKILEKVVSSRIDKHLLATKLIDQDQTAYRKFNSTETALMCIHNDILRNMDKGRATLLLMLDLSAAYDTIDHDIFLFRLTNYFGISGLPEMI